MEVERDIRRENIICKNYYAILAEREWTVAMMKIAIRYNKKDRINAKLIMFMIIF